MYAGCGNDPCYSVFFITALCVWCSVKIRESGERYDPLFLFMALRNMKCTIQMAILMILLVWANTTVLLVNFLTLVYGFGLMGYFFAAYYKKAFGKYLNPEENS